MPREKMSDVVVLLPGLMGSILSKGGKDIWSASPGSLLGGLVTGGGRFKDLIVREDPPDQDDLGDGIVASRVMPDVHLIPGLWKIDGYSKLADTIKSSFEIFSCYRIRLLHCVNLGSISFKEANILRCSFRVYHANEPQTIVRTRLRQANSHIPRAGLNYCRV